MRAPEETEQPHPERLHIDGLWLGQRFIGISLRPMQLTNVPNGTPWLHATQTVE